MSVRLSLLFQRDAVLPPFTGRTLKSVLAKAGCLEGVRRLYESQGRPRPVSLSPLYRGRRPLYVRYKPGQPEPPRPTMVAREGEELSAYISYYVRNPQGLARALEGIVACDETVDIGYALIHVSTAEVSVQEMKSLTLEHLEGEDTLKIVFETPVILTTKALTPPPLAPRRLIRDTRQAYRLLPTPGYIMAYAAKLWMHLAYARGTPLDPVPYAVARLSDIMMAEIDFNLKPETVLYKGKDSGKPLKVRGVTGYVAYHFLNNRIKQIASKLLALAQTMGLGKSRSIGFGRIRVEEFKPRTP